MLIMVFCLSACGNDAIYDDTGKKLEANPVENFSYKIDDDETYVTITGYNGDDTDIVIPKKIEKLPVTTVGGLDDLDIKSVIVPEGVTTLLGGAFYCCLELEKVSLPSTLQTIGDRAFDNCSALLFVISSKTKKANTPIVTTNING